MRSLEKQAALGLELDRIEKLERAALLSLWNELVGCPAPKSLSLSFLRRVVAYETQIRARGGLPGKTKRKLARIARAATQSRECGQTDQALSIDTTTARLEPGARLVRDWNGSTWVVDVTDAGFVMRGKTYRSLTAIAKEITGAHWSGPRFFGLTGRPNPKRNQSSSMGAA